MQIKDNMFSVHLLEKNLLDQFHENYINSIESTINIFYPPNVIKPCNEIINIINYQIKKNTVNRS